MILQGIRVVEFGMAWAGPLLTRFLGDFGADVIKIEQRTARGAGLTDTAAAMAADAAGDWQWGQLPEPTFRAGVFPDADPGAHPWNRAGIWNKMNRNKRSLCIDLKQPDGWRVFEALIRTTDILFDNLSPRGVDSLGIDDASMRTLNPRLIRISLSGYGHTGPYRDRVSYGPILEAHSGLAAATGYRGGGPVKQGTAFPDPIGGLHGTFAALAALWERDRTGQGLFLDISQLETYAAIGGELLLQTSVGGEPPVRPGNRSPQYAPQGVYPCAGDDQWIAITIRSDAEWAHFVDHCGPAELHDPAYATVLGRVAAHDAIDEAIAAWTRAQPKEQLAQELQARGIAAMGVLTNGDLVQDPHIADRGFMATWDQPEVGERAFPGFPIHFSNTPQPELRPAPPLGNANTDVLRELGYDDADIARLAEAGVVADHP